MEKERKGEGGKESPACFCPSTFVQMTGRQIRALKANGGQRNPARVNGSMKGMVEISILSQAGCVLLSAALGGFGYHRGWNSGASSSSRPVLHRWHQEQPQSPRVTKR